MAGIGAAQQAYVAPGQLDEPWFERTSALVDELAIDVEQARAGLRSPGAAEALDGLTVALETLVVADARVRQNLRIGQVMMASDVVFSDGRNILETMVATLRDLWVAEHASHRAGLSVLSRERWIALGAVTLWSVVGLVGLAMMRASTSQTAAAGQRPAVHQLAPAEPVIEPPPRIEPAAPLDLASAKQAEPLDLASAARLCTDLSRVTTTAALPALLGRAARVLDASGVVLWMCAGDQLFAVAAHGYRPEVLSRLGPIARDADNAAAAAWRTGQLTAIGATGDAGCGAIVVPLFGLHACVGVLAAELRHGSEHHPTTQAVATMIAAQLAAVVPAWPAPRVTEPTGAVPDAEPQPSPQQATREVRSA